MGMSCTREGLIMSIVNKLLRNFSEGKSRIPVVASAVAIGVALALTTCGTPAPAFEPKLDIYQIGDILITDETKERI